MKLKYNYIVLFIFIIFSISGILSFSKFNTLNVKFYLELLLIMFTLLAIKYIKKELFPYLLISILYIAYGYIFLLIKHDNIIDYIYIYKTFVYIILLIFLVNKKWFDVVFIKKLFYILIFSFLIKYIYSLALNLAHRPGVFTENNFELMFLLLIFIGKIHLEKSLKFFDYILIIFIVVLSGSRSAIIALATLTLFINFNRNKLYTYLKYGLIISSFVLSYYIFMSRMQNMNIEEIDRIKFLFIFLDEIKEWNLWNYLVGNQPMTPLSTEHCSELSYYKSLFSNQSTNLCYSVVLHSYILRTILDHGILGLFFIFYFIYKILKISKFQINEIFMVLSVLLINSLSVSSLNSIFSIFGILLLIAQKKETHANPK